MPSFKQITSETPIKELIKSAFDTDLALDGGWGYNRELATRIEDPKDIPLHQLEHMIASMRAYLEMNMTQKKDNRYGSINVNEISRENQRKDEFSYDKVIYEITAIKESTYATFITEYKEGYGKETFDLNAHFKRRKEATLTRREIHWFLKTNFS